MRNPSKLPGPTGGSAPERHGVPVGRAAADGRAPYGCSPDGRTDREGRAERDGRAERAGRTLVVTNDFPPRRGGIETFVHEITSRWPADDTVVYTAAQPGSDAFDAAQPFTVVRDRARLLLPTPRVAATARALAFRYGCDRVWFGAAAPLGLLAARIGLPAVATTHGHEVWWAALPGSRAALRRIGDTVTTVTYLTEHSRARLAPALGPRAHLERLTPGVDPRMFRPRDHTPGHRPSGNAPPDAPARAADGTTEAMAGHGPDVRAELGLGAGPLILSVSRLVPRKGQDVLIRALPRVRRAVPGTRLLIVGSGPYERALRRAVRREPELPPDAVVLAGPRDHAHLPPYYAAADVFAMPCRTRRFGLETEGFGIVCLEAAAAGLPVLTGASGGAPEAVRDGETGRVVDGRDPTAVAAHLVELLGTPDGPRPGVGAAAGRRGREWVARAHTWDAAAQRLRDLLSRTVEQ